MSKLTIRLAVLEDGDEAMAVDIGFVEMHQAMDAYFDMVSRLLSCEEFAKYMQEVKDHVASMGRLQ